MFDYLLICNYGYNDFTSNCIQHILKNTINPNIYVYCSDEESLDKLNKKFSDVSNVNLILYNKENVSKSFANYASEDFNQITKKIKIGSILFHMEKNNKQILYVDSDVVILNEPPLSNFKNFDIVFAPENMENSWVCTGFMFINNTENARKILEISHLDTTNKNDQEVICSHLGGYLKNGDVRNFSENNTKIGVFEREFYISGWLRRDSPLRDVCNKNVMNKKAVMYHANCIVGKLSKINDLKSIGYWVE